MTPCVSIAGTLIQEIRNRDTGIVELTFTVLSCLQLLANDSYRIMNTIPLLSPVFQILKTCLYF